MGKKGGMYVLSLDFKRVGIEVNPTKVVLEGGRTKVVQELL